MHKFLLPSLVIGAIIVGFTHGQINLNAPEASASTEEVSSATSTTEYPPCLKLGPHQYFCGDEDQKDWKLKELYTENQELKSKRVKATISFYTSEARQTDDSPEIAANGQNIWHLYQNGQKTCASNDYKIGTKLSIEGIGTCIVRDRMNSRYTGTGRIDWYLGYSHADAWDMGLKKNVTVEILR